MEHAANRRHRTPFLSAIGPGLLVAATGVGAGDLATSSFSGSQLGTAILWAVVLGALLKFVVNEGLARWQLSTDKTLMEGTMLHFGRWVGWAFLPYLLLWSFVVGSALMSACGVTLQAIVPAFDDPQHGKVVFGVLSSLCGLVLVWRGGYHVFETIMRICIGTMFVAVVLTAYLVGPDAVSIVEGLFIPRVPQLDGAGLSWTVALIGGVGGTVTILCYGYWLRESGRDNPSGLWAVRVDLVVAYVVTAVFGIAMVIIGSTLELRGSGAGLVVELARKLEAPLGPLGKAVFLAGAFGAVFSSLLGVWQAVPYLFADTLHQLVARHDDKAVHPPTSGSAAYRAYLLALGVIPSLRLDTNFMDIQKLYASIGAAFIPLLALSLLLLNGRASLVGQGMKNGWRSTLSLLGTLAFFAWAGWYGATK